MNPQELNVWGLKVGGGREIWIQKPNRWVPSRQRDRKNRRTERQPGYITDELNCMEKNC